MERLTDQRTIEAFTHARSRFPSRLQPWLACDLHTEDPIWTGFNGPWPEARGGRSYREVAHVSYPTHQMHMPRDRRYPTVVLPGPGERNYWTCVHELGHVLHWWLADHLGVTSDSTRDGWPWLAAPSSDPYYRQDPWEEFAGAVEGYMLPYPAECDRYLDMMSSQGHWWSAEVDAFIGGLPARP